MADLPLVNPNNAGVGTGNFGQPIDVGALTAAPKFNVPTYTPPLSTPVAPPPAIDFGIAAKQTAADSAQADLKAVLDQQGNQAVVKSNLETAQGIPQINSQLQELYAQDAKYQSDLSNIASQQLQANNTSEDRQAPMFAINGEQAQIARQAQIAQQNINIQRSTNAAAITAAQGKLSLAQQYVQDALDRQFTPLASKIDYLKTVLAQNQNTLSKAEQEQLQQQITDQQNAYDQQKQDKTDIYNVLLAAAKNGADNVTLLGIQNAATPIDAVTAAGTSLATANTQIVQAGGAVKLVDTNTGKTIANLGATEQALSLARTSSGGGTAGGGSTKAPTATQVTYGNYAPRLQTADQQINGLTGSITGMSPITYAIYTRLPSFLQPSAVQQYNQAKLNFENAVLRQESGAAISDSERAAYEKQYFPLPGDSADTVAQKAQNRAQVIQSYIQDAGGAYSSPAGSDPYADYRDQLQPGEILVQRGSQIIAITPDELQAKDQRL